VSGATIRGCDMSASVRASIWDRGLVETGLLPVVGL
jgi:hypothetical protein